VISEVCTASVIMADDGDSILWNVGQLLLDISKQKFCLTLGDFFPYGLPT
jgi:hypothetical protein